MPEEVFTLWLDRAIDEHGWAPESSEWASLLRRRRMSYWRELEWREKRLVVRNCKLTAETRHAASGIVRAAFTGIENGYSGLAKQHDSRLQRLVKAAMATETLPGELVCIRMPDGAIDVVDGIIRFAALLHAFQHGVRGAFVQAWVGSLPESV